MATTYPKINSFTYRGKQINKVNNKPIRYVYDNRAGANKTYEMVYAPQEYTDCITFTGETSDFTLAIGSDGAKEWDGIVEYSTDHNTWTEWDGSEISSNGQKLYLRGSGNTAFRTSSGARFVLSARAACSGNIQTLLEYSNPPISIPADYCYNNLFRDCTNLTTAPELPATTLAYACYYNMFYNCTSLTTTPELPATTLTNQCYNGMFSGCTGLTTAPALPATTLASSCYGHLFRDCTNLITAPVLPATTLADGCYGSMFNGCTSLTQAPVLPATTLAERCYNSMFHNCTSLTQAPELPATTLATWCYSYMFQGCTNLTRAPELPATTLATQCCLSMFNGCTNLRISTTQSSEYPTAWRIPSSGTISSTAANWSTYMLKGTGGTFTSDPSIDTTYYGAWSSDETTVDPEEAAYYMTISGLGNSSPTSQTYVSSGAAFPTSFEEVTKDGDIFIKIPTMYRKVNTVVDNQITSFTISNVKEDDTYLPYPCFVRPDGSVVNYILIGKYMISSKSTANSVNASTVNLTPAQGIALCKNKGAGYYPYDVWTQKLFQDLELAIGKKVNYQDGSAKIMVSKIGLNHLDKGHWVLGVIGSSGSWYACYDPDKYQALSGTSSSIPSDYVQIGYVQPTTNGLEIQKLGYDESNPFFNYPMATVSNSSFNTYYCDRYYYGSGNHPVASNVGYLNVSFGLWFCDAYDLWSNGFGVRLCFRPL